MASLTYATFASSTKNGALVEGLNPATATWLAATNPGALAAYVNQSLVAAEAHLPEGTRVELDITGWNVLFGSTAALVASQIQGAYAAGKMRDPSTGKIPPAWPEYAGVIATGNAATDTVTLRWVKGDLWTDAVVIGIITILVAVVVFLLSNASWQAKSATTTSGGTTNPPGLSFLQFVLQNWALVTVGALALVAAPFIVHEVARTKAAEHELFPSGEEVR